MAGNVNMAAAAIAANGVSAWRLMAAGGVMASMAKYLAIMAWQWRGVAAGVKCGSANGGGGGVSIG